MLNLGKVSESNAYKYRRVLSEKSDHQWEFFQNDKLGHSKHQAIFPLLIEPVYTEVELAAAYIVRNKEEVI